SFLASVSRQQYFAIDKSIQATIGHGGCRLPRKRTSAIQLAISALRQKRTSYHSITSSAVERRLAETFSPSVFATLRLITNSNLFDSTTGMSAGFLPFRI